MVLYNKQTVNKLQQYRYATTVCGAGVQATVPCTVHRHHHGCGWCVCHHPQRSPLVFAMEPANPSDRPNPIDRLAFVSVLCCVQPPLSYRNNFVNGHGTNGQAGNGEKYFTGKLVRGSICFVLWPVLISHLMANRCRC